MSIAIFLACFLLLAFDAWYGFLGEFLKVSAWAGVVFSALALGERYGEAGRSG